MSGIVKKYMDRYVWRGTVDLGELGFYSEDMITIDSDMCGVAGVVNNDSEEEKILKMSIYYDNRFQDISKDKYSLGEQFKMWIITYLCEIQYPFWEDFRYEDEMEYFLWKTGSIEKPSWNKSSNTEYPSYVNSNEIRKYEGKNGSIPCIFEPCPVYESLLKYDVYKNEEGLKSYEIVNKYLPALKLDKMIQTIKPEKLSACGEMINFQVSSDICGGMLFSATYGTIDIHNKLEVSHNC